MTREATRFVALLLAAVLAAAVLVACGGSDSDTSASTSSGESGGAAGNGNGSRDEGKSNGGGSQAKHKSGGSQSGSEPRPVDAAPLRVSGGGSAQFRTKEGDNSIQEFGEESDESELEEAATELHDFYVARAEGDFTGACSYLGETVVKQFEALAARSKQLAGKGCAGALEAFLAPLPEPLRRESTVVDAVSLRFEDERAFLIYRDAEGEPYAMPMEQDEGWRVGALTGTPLL